MQRARISSGLAPRLPDAGPALERPRARHWPPLILRAGKSALAHDLPLLASAVAYSAFLALPATLLVVVGLFSLAADPSLISSLVERLATVAPAEVTDLLEESLVRLEEQPSAGVVMTAAGLVLALWTTTGAMSTAMRAIAGAHETADERGFLLRRLVALALVVVLGSTVLLVAVLLVLGPHVEGWVGSALGAETLVAWTWWSLQWPVLILALLAAFAAVFALATPRRARRWLVVSPGTVVAALLWLAASGAFAAYASQFGSYNKTWGTLSAAIVMLVWLWISALALLFGAEVNAEVERTARGRAARVSGIGERSRESRARPAA